MTKIADAVRAGDVEAPDVLVGGTPCQAFSIAGLRGLSDDRGQLTLLRGISQCNRRKAPRTR
jgi:DNA (cytosine-5)-methyltransferase 1